MQTTDRALRRALLGGGGGRLHVHSFWLTRLVQRGVLKTVLGKRASASSATSLHNTRSWKVRSLDGRLKTPRTAPQPATKTVRGHCGHRPSLGAGGGATKRRSAGQALRKSCGSEKKRRRRKRLHVQNDFTSVKPKYWNSHSTASPALNAVMPTRAWASRLLVGVAHAGGSAPSPRAAAAAHATAVALGQCVRIRRSTAPQGSELRVTWAKRRVMGRGRRVKGASREGQRRDAVDKRLKLNRTSTDSNAKGVWCPVSWWGRFSRGSPVLGKRPFPRSLCQRSVLEGVTEQWAGKQLHFCQMGGGGSPGLRLELGVLSIFDFREDGPVVFCSAWVWLMT